MLGILIPSCPVADAMHAAAESYPHLRILAIFLKTGVRAIGTISVLVSAQLVRKSVGSLTELVSHLS
jgi:hypothetical protein